MEEPAASPPGDPNDVPASSMRYHQIFRRVPFCSTLECSGPLLFA